MKGQMRSRQSQRNSSAKDDAKNTILKIGAWSTVIWTLFDLK